jgi:predicted DNA-binding protein with PD1-like motif
MKIILHDKNTYVLKANVGEEVIGQLQEFCKEQKIGAAKFFAIGSAKELKLGWYDVATKEYTWQEFSEELEIISLLGTIAWKPFDLAQGKEVIAHAHGSFSNRQMQVVGGHVAKLVVGAACEIVLEKFEGHIEKAYDDQTGLNLMQ